MEQHTSALDRPSHSDHLRFLLSILTTLFPGAHTYGYRAGSTFIKISKVISDVVHAPGRMRLARSDQGGKIDREPVYSTAADGTNRNTSTGRGYFQVRASCREGSPEERRNSIDIPRK